MQVHGITTARRSQRDDVHDRMVKYGVSMGIRLVCFVLAFVFYGHWSSWIFVAGAVLLPYVAVLLANAGRETAPRAPAALLPPGAASAPRPTAPAPRSALGPVTVVRDESAGDRPGRGEWQHSYPPPGSRSDQPAAVPQLPDDESPRYRARAS